jgi:hypothetical protein
MYSRISWAATSGRVPIGSQHGRGRFMRPKRASSVNMMRSRLSRRVAARRAFLTASGKCFFRAMPSFFGYDRGRANAVPAAEERTLVHRTQYRTVLVKIMRL